jgi:hypothetical protein
MGARSAKRSQAAAQQQADQDAEIAQLQAQHAPAAAPAPSELDVVAQIQKFATLKDQGLITEEEFAAKKKQLLGI